jgi:hypothetical protein
MSATTSGSNTSAPPSADGQHKSTSNLVTLNDHSVADLSCINSTSIHEPLKALRESIALVQYLLENTGLAATTMAVEHDYLRQQCDQDQFTWLIAESLVTTT